MTNLEARRKRWCLIHFNSAHTRVLYHRTGKCFLTANMLLVQSCLGKTFSNTDIQSIYCNKSLSSCPTYVVSSPCTLIIICNTKLLSDTCACDSGNAKISTNFNVWIAHVERIQWQSSEHSSFRSQGEGWSSRRRPRCTCTRSDV